MLHGPNPPAVDPRLLRAYQAQEAATLAVRAAERALEAADNALHRADDEVMRLEAEIARQSRGAV